MRKYTESDMFIQMNAGNAIYNQLSLAVKSIDNTCILNDKLKDTLEAMQHAFKETITLKVIDAIRQYDLIIVCLPIDKRFPANIPYVRTKRKGKDCMIVDISKYCTITREPDGTIMEVKCDIPKLQAITVPAFLSLKVLDGTIVLSTETTKWMAYLWAKMFNRILLSQKIFVGNAERYEAFMYFAMRFFMIYYLETNPQIVDRVSGEFIKNTKSNYILMIESTLKQKNIDLYKDWSTFAYTMFSNEVTNIRAVTNVEMNTEQYLRLFSNMMGRDGSYLALWSAEYFLYCLFVTYNRAYILNDRAWQSIVDENRKIMPRILGGLYKEL